MLSFDSSKIRLLRTTSMVFFANNRKSKGKSIRKWIDGLGDTGAATYV